MKIEKLNKLMVAPLLLVALTLGACSSQKQIEGSGASVVPIAKTKKEQKTNTGPKSGTIAGGGASGVDSSEIRGAGVNNNPYDSNDISLAGLNDPNNLLSQRVIYFDYDKAAIRPEYMILINTHAKLAAKYPQIRMRLEGHADERGSREYNVALSEARAKSVRSIMGTQGARASQIKTIGYGEEVPLVAGHNKRSWEKNRRVEIKYENY